MLELVIVTLSLLSAEMSHSQTVGDSCNSPVSLSWSLPFPTAPLQCVPVWASQNFILRYFQAGPNLWNFLLSAPNSNGYVAMGFSPNGNMVGSTAIVAWVATDGTSASLNRYFLGGQTPNLVTLDRGGALQIVNSSVSFQSNQIYIPFQLIIDNPTPYLIYAVGPPGRLPVAPAYQLTQHRAMISTRLNYATGGFATTTQLSEENLKRTHGILSMLGWGILTIIGAMVARYAKKWDPYWFYTHAGIQSIAFVLGLSGVICGLVLENELGVSVDKHKAIGILILVMGCVQVMAVLARPHKDSKVRKYWNWYHHNVGRSLIILAAVNVFVGIHLGRADSSWNVAYGAILVVFLVIALILELRIIFSH